MDRKERHKIAAQKYRAQHKKLHLCVDCAAPAVLGTLRCSTHLYKKQIDNSKHYRERIEKGLCSRCGAPLNLDSDFGHTQCINCRENSIPKIYLKLLS